MARAKYYQVIGVDGLKELEQRLLDLPLDIAARQITSALRSAAKPMLKKMQENARNLRHPASGALAESIGFRAGRKPRNRPATQTFLGPMVKNKKAAAMYKDYYGRGGTGVFHGHLVEFGTEHSAAQPWMRPAIDSTADSIPAAFGRDLAKRLDARVKKLQQGKKL